jgi:hypothetical protein
MYTFSKYTVKGFATVGNSEQNMFCYLKIFLGDVNANFEYFVCKHLLVAD